MKKYTKEYITTPGNIIDFPEKIKLRSRALLWNESSPEQETVHNAEVGKKKVYGYYPDYKGMGAYVAIDNVNYSGENYWLIPVSELERVGLIEEDPFDGKTFYSITDIYERTLYTIIKKKDNYYVTWSGNYEGVLYEKEKIEEFFRDGTWIDSNKSNNKNKEISHYEVIKKVPLSARKIGDRLNAKESFEEYAQYPEFFKPVYKEDIIKIGGYDLEIVRGKGVSFNEVKFGCQTFSLQELDTIKKLIFSPIDAKISIYGTDITQELIQKIINKLV